MLLNLDENFLAWSDDDFDSHLSHAHSLNVENKDDFIQLFEYFVQLDSLIETYDDLGIKIKNFSDKLGILENNLLTLRGNYSFSEHELLKMGTFLNIEKENNLRRDFFQTYRKSSERFNFSFTSSLEDYYISRDSKVFSPLFTMAKDQDHQEIMMKILDTRPYVHNPGIYEKTASLLSKLSDEDFLPIQKTTPKISYSDIIDSIIAIVAESFNVKVKVNMEENGKFLYLEDKGIIYLDSFRRKGKLNKSWTQVIQRGDTKGRKAICVVGFSLNNEIDPNDIRSIFHEFGHAFHHIITGDQNFFKSGMNSLAPYELETPSIYMERYLLERNNFLNFWDNTEAYEYIVNHYKVLLNKTIFLSFLDQAIHKKKFKNFEELCLQINNKINTFNLTIPYLCAETATSFAHIFEDDMYAGNYFWYLHADFWYEELDSKEENPFILKSVQ